MEYDLHTATLDVLTNKDFTKFQQTQADLFRHEASFAEASVQTFGTKALHDLAPASSYKDYNSLVLTALHTDKILNGNQPSNNAANAIDKDLRLKLSVNFGQMIQPSELEDRLTKFINAENLSKRLSSQLKEKTVSHPQQIKI